MPWGFEAFHNALTLSGPLVTVFGPDIQALVRTTLDPQHDIALRRRVGAQFVHCPAVHCGCNVTRAERSRPWADGPVVSTTCVSGAGRPSGHTGLEREHPARTLPDGQSVKAGACVPRSRERPCPIPFDADLASPPATDRFREFPSKFITPDPHRFVRCYDSALRKKILDQSQAQGKLETQPDSVSNHVRRETVAANVC